MQPRGKSFCKGFVVTVIENMRCVENRGGCDFYSNCPFSFFKTPQEEHCIVYEADALQFGGDE
ncbi:hypothetical protein IFM89_028043 [Coptis chinensis]|uniref:Uncharacterized protein n=1 Tax=Coptis chinensis TaxID=261450 RepID=A0A835LT29_9MAGN|nr:hypothetical protein IFM89_028043 [Coptis chinensis]